MERLTYWRSLLNHDRLEPDDSHLHSNPRVRELKVQAHEKAREDQVASGIRQIGSEAHQQDEYDGVYWRRDAYTAKEWTADALTTCGAADLEYLEVGPTIPARGPTLLRIGGFADWIDCMLAYPDASPTLGEMFRT
ncbi:hypothetical protein GB937_000994 [Aspergillus fischeri]|nr:hypothetical protein GB937_000994 [Aspergillus fischeri]